MCAPHCHLYVITCGHNYIPLFVFGVMFLTTLKEITVVSLYIHKLYVIFYFIISSISFTKIQCNKGPIISTLYLGILSYAGFIKRLVK